MTNILINIALVLLIIELADRLYRSFKYQYKQAKLMRKLKKKLQARKAGVRLGVVSPNESRWLFGMDLSKEPEPPGQFGTKA